MWFSRQHTAASETFAARLQQVENACFRRLNFVESQLNRVGRHDRRWDAHVTVMDADIEPVGATTMTLYVIRNPSLWPLWVYALIGGLIILAAAVVAAGLW